MNKQEAIKRHKKNVNDAFTQAEKGEVINLSALIGGYERILTTKEDEDITEVYSDNWKVEKEEEETRVKARQEEREARETKGKHIWQWQWRP